METGSRYELSSTSSHVTPGNRVIMKNIGGDEPFGGDIPGSEQVFGETDRIMAFDVDQPLDTAVSGRKPHRDQISVHAVGTAHTTARRKVALFEGKDEFGRLQPLLGTAEPATDYPRQSDQLAEHARVLYAMPSVLTARWKAPSPGTAPPPKTRPSIPPRSGRSGTSPVTPTRCICTW